MDLFIQRPVSGAVRHHTALEVRRAREYPAKYQRALQEVSALQIHYFEETDSMIVSFELDPARKVGQLHAHDLSENTVVFADEAGNIESVEIISDVQERYGEDPVTVEGLPALLMTFPFPKNMSFEELKARKEEIIEYGRRSWRGGPYRKKESDS